jgi:diguanylate cyclase (GGDEF)-like protein
MYLFSAILYSSSRIGSRLIMKDFARHFTFHAGQPSFLLYRLFVGRMNPSARRPSRTSCTTLTGFRHECMNTGLNLEVRNIRKGSRFFYGAALPPLICIGLAALLWSVTLSRLEQERTRAEQSIRNNAALYAASYAGQIARLVTQIDQLTLNLKFYTELANQAPDLEAQQKAGLFPGSSLMYASIIDRNGYRLSSTLPDKPNRSSIAEREFFQLHKQDSSAALLISPPLRGINSGNVLLRFTRRINSPTGDFNGLAVVSVEPAYFAPALNDANLGNSGRLWLVRRDGQLLTEKNGKKAAHSAKHMPSALMLQGEKGIVERAQAISADSSSAPVHVLAWEKIPNYPLLAFASLSKEEMLREYHTLAREYRRLAGFGSLFLLLVACAGSILAIRLSQRKRQDSEIKNTYLLATEGAREGFYMLRALYGDDRKVRDFVIEDCNQRGAAFYGLSKHQMLGKRLSGFAEACGKQTMDTFLHAMETGFHEDEFKAPAKNPLHVIWMQRRVVRSGNGLAVTLRDISELKAHEALLSRLAHADPLTSLPNRHWMMQYLPLAIERAAKQQTTLALLFIDLDNFKSINDSAGHAAGDEVLKIAAARLQSAVREQDHVVRLGGDEFTIILENTEGHTHVAPLAERIVHALNEPFTLRGIQHHSVNGSVGISLYPQDGATSEILLQHADTAMYAAKANGKGQYQFYQPSLSERLMSLVKAKQELNSAIELDEFVLYYQPRINAISGKLCGLEALVRWNHPERGVVGPQEFIRLAEDNRLIPQLGELIIHNVFAHLAQWQLQELPIVPVSINVSPSQLSQGNLAPLLTACLRKYALDPQFIGIEVSESCTTADAGATHDALRAIDRLGIRLMVDNFGAGHSSMLQLHALNIAALKIDKTVTAQLCREKNGDAYCMAILSMAHVLGMQVIAEGVETIEQLQTLQELSCNEVQGFAISAPVPVSDVPALLRRRLLLPAASSSSHSLMSSAREYSDLGYS